MLKNARLCTYYTLALVTAGALSAQAAETAGGLYCHTTKVSLSQPLNKEGGCDAPYEKPKGLNYCQAVSNQSSEALITYVTKDGDLKFYTSLVMFPYSSLCDIGGVAKKSGDGWRYEYGMNDPDPDMHCIIDIQKKANGDISFTTDKVARCTALCGHNATMDGVVIPADSRKSAIGSEKEYKENLGKYAFSELCPELPQPAPQ